jgi:hypothetical protein
VHWVSSSTGVASVSQSGQATSIGSGNTTVTGSISLLPARASPQEAQSSSMRLAPTLTDQSRISPVKSPGRAPTRRSYPSIAWVSRALSRLVLRPYPQPSEVRPARPDRSRSLRRHLCRLP